MRIGAVKYFLRSVFVACLLVAGLNASVAAMEKKADAVAELSILQGKLSGKNVVRVTEGQIVELRWSSDRVTELHLHGYDIVAKPKPGAPAVMRFKAHATGRYPVTVHGHAKGGGHTEKTMLYLEVHPN